jgi:4-amino-4-deoxy-L-arabinose transferase-like glycosyltransferase
MRDRSARVVSWLLAVAFLATRLFHLMALPMFIDESIYLFWARRIVTDGRLWRPLADGKSLQVWALAVVVPWVEDPLWWGRGVSVIVGGAGAWAAWAIARRLQSERAGLLAAGLYVLCPFALFHDRMVLADVFVSTAAALTLLATLALLEAPSVLRSALLGLALAACACSKMPGLLMWALPLFASVGLPRPAKAWRALGRAFALAIALSTFPVWYFFQNSAQVQEQAALGDVGGPLAVVAPNLAALAGWMWDYWTPGICAVFLVVTAVALWRRSREDLVLSACALWPPLVFAAASRSWFPRYVFPSTIPALVLVALALSRLVAQARRVPYRWLVTLSIVVALAVPSLRFDAALLTAPDRAPFPPIDRLQYVEGWTAGYGREPVARALASALSANPGGLLVGVGGASRHAWRPLHLLLRAHFMNEPRVRIEVSDPRDPASRRALAGKAGGRPVFLAAGVDDEVLPATGSPPVLIGRRPDGAAVAALYRLPRASAPDSN